MGFVAGAGAPWQKPKKQLCLRTVKMALARLFRIKSASPSIVIWCGSSDSGAGDTGRAGARAHQIGPKWTSLSRGHVFIMQPM